MARRVQHPGDAGGPLVAGGPQVESGGVALVVGGAEHRHRPGVGHLGQQGAEGDDRAGADGDGDTEHVVAERAPLQLGLDAGEQHHAVAVRGGGGLEDVGGPLDAAAAVEVDADLGPGGGEVEEDLGVDVGEGPGAPLLDQVVDGGGGGVAGVVPAPERGDEDRPVGEVGLGRPAQVGEALARGVRHRPQGTGAAGDDRPGPRRARRSGPGDGRAYAGRHVERRDRRGHRGHPRAGGRVRAPHPAAVDVEPAAHRGGARRHRRLSGQHPADRGRPRRRRCRPRQPHPRLVPHPHRRAGVDRGRRGRRRGPGSGGG